MAATAAESAAPDKTKARPKAKLPQPLIDFWVDYPDSEKTESESKTTDKTHLDEMVANKTSTTTLTA
jgi:hypothetical protein